MSIFDKHIVLGEFLNVSLLSTRATARELMKQIKTLRLSVVLDFEDIEFASRSFMDELNILVKESRWTRYTYVHMNEQVRRMKNLVERSAKSDFVHKSDKNNSSQSSYVSM